MAEILSHKTITIGGGGGWKKQRSCRSHNNSEVMEAIALYSASAEDLETVSYLLDF